MENVRLKCGIEKSQLENRLSYNPEIIELQLFEKDMYHINDIYEAIHKAKEQGSVVYLHHPMTRNDIPLDILSQNKDVKDFYVYSSHILSEICRKEDIYCVIHAHYAGTESSLMDRNIENSILMKTEIEKIKSFEDKYFLWENTIEGLFSHENEFLFEHIVKPLNLPFCFDISHSIISTKGDNELVIKKLDEFHSHTVYYHVVDSLGKTHDSLPLGQGKIEWKRVKPFIEGKDFIFEIGLTDYNDCTPMIDSVHFYNHL